MAKRRGTRLSGRVWVGVVALGLTWLSASPPAQATLMLELSLEELVVGCDAIVHGVVERTGTQMAVAGSSEPYTVARLRVDEWILGSGGPTVVVRELGATWATGAMRVDGTPTYDVGEEVVVFLRRTENGYYQTYSMVQGKFGVRRDAPGARPLVERDMRAASFLRGITLRDTRIAQRRLERVTRTEPNPNSVLRFEHGELSTPMGLEDLVQRVRALKELLP